MVSTKISKIIKYSIPIGLTLLFSSTELPGKKYEDVIQDPSFNEICEPREKNYQVEGKDGKQYEVRNYRRVDKGIVKDCWLVL